MQALTIVLALMHALIALVGTSCGTSADDTSDSRVIGGAPGPARSPVVQINTSSGQCSAVFVSNTTALTAAHCFKGSPSVNYLNIQGDAIAIGGEDERDLAVLLFKNAIAPSVASIGTVRPSKGTIGTVAGFGCATINGSGSGLLRVASMRLEGSILPGLITSQWAPEGVCHGDSGGGLFVQNRLVGITQGFTRMKVIHGPGRETFTYMNHWVDLNSATSRAFLRHAISLGAKIPGL